MSPHYFHSVVEPISKSVLGSPVLIYIDDCCGHDIADFAFDVIEELLLGLGARLKTSKWFSVVTKACCGCKIVDDDILQNVFAEPGVIKSGRSRSKQQNIKAFGELHELLLHQLLGVIGITATPVRLLARYEFYLFSGLLFLFTTAGLCVTITPIGLDL